MSDPTAPGALESVRLFVNTLDIEAGTDQLADLDSWSAWAGDGQERHISDEDLQRLRRLREAIRTALLGNHNRQPLSEETTSELQEALDWSGARPVLLVDGLGLAPGGQGAQGLAGRVLSAMATAMADGTWTRLKACRDDACHWAFYDHSRSRTGQWCSMEICGNRNKQNRWRARQAPRREDGS